ncbi:uncharacterized protein LOC126899990 isoform X2 [Daktulosphaira vitifoliae]|uniref:uncharacterized protein LOC126899990 isoform X2 n=1 Tax=Daktulosphaira vitifoliae TaxID=58002 RepID=UPI0021AAAB94|nr:uncharacterized protein LOC126899990 isoform X2 [Daktulosphaira vitifoliae]
MNVNMKNNVFNWSIWIFLFLSLSTFFIVSAQQSVDLCYRDDPKIDVCIKEKVNEVVDKFHKGIDEYGLKYVEPVFAEAPLSFEQKGRLIGGKISVKNMITEGLTTIKLKSLRTKFINPNKVEVGFTAHYRSIKTSGQYKFKGYMGRIAINANGIYNITFKDVEASYLLSATAKQMKNDTFLQIDNSLTHPPKFGDTKVQATELVAGNAVLSRVALRFANQYATQMADELFPVVEPSLDAIQKEMGNRILQLYPYDDLLPPTRVK